MNHDILFYYNKTVIIINMIQNTYSNQKNYYNKRHNSSLFFTLVYPQISASSLTVLSFFHSC